VGHAFGACKSVLFENLFRVHCRFEIVFLIGGIIGVPHGVSPHEKKIFTSNTTGAGFVSEMKLPFRAPRSNHN
jgi:hypothetical protein